MIHSWPCRVPQGQAKPCPYGARRRHPDARKGMAKSRPCQPPGPRTGVPERSRYSSYVDRMLSFVDMCTAVFLWGPACARSKRGQEVTTFACCDGPRISPRALLFLVSVAHCAETHRADPRQRGSDGSTRDPRRRSSSRAVRVRPPPAARASRPLPPRPTRPPGPS